MLKFKNKLKGVKCLGAEIVIDGNHLDTEIDFGSLTLTKEDRNYVIDVVQSYREFKDGQTNISLEFEIDKEIFPKDDEYNYELTVVDLLSEGLSAKLYCGGDEAPDWEHATLFVRYRKMTKAINLDYDEYKVARLVKVELTTRVIVDENATYDEVINASYKGFQDKLNNFELIENVISTNRDKECPYGTFETDK